MKKLFIAAVLGLDAMYRFWGKLKDVRESVLESKNAKKSDAYLSWIDEVAFIKDEQATLENKELRTKNLVKLSSIVSGNKDDISNENVNMFEKYGQILIYPQTVEKVWEGTAIDHTEHDFGFFMSIKADDFDNSVKILIAKAWKSDTPEHYKHIDVMSINQYKDFQHALDEIKYTIGCYSNIKLLLIPNGAGMGFAQALKNRGIGFESISLGGNCFSENDQKNYVNKRSQAFVDLSRAVWSNRLKIKTQHFIDEIKEQLVSLHYNFDENARFKVLPNHKLQKKGIFTLEMAELLAYMFLNGVEYKPVGDGEEQQEKIDPKNMNFIDFCKEILGNTKFYDTETVCRELSQKGSNLSLTFAGLYYSQMTHVAKDDFTYQNRGFTSKGISILAVFAVWSLLCEDASKIYLLTEKCAESSNFLKGFIENHKIKLKKNGYQYLADQIIIGEDCIYIDGYKDTRFICVKEYGSRLGLQGLELENVTVWCDIPEKYTICSKEIHLHCYAELENARLVISNRPWLKIFKLIDDKWLEYTFNAENVDGPYTQFIKNELKKYGSRNHPDYLYFVRGIHPYTKAQE